LTLNTIVEDGMGSGNVGKVSSYNAVYICEDFPDVPAIGTANRYRFFSARLGSTGADSGTTSMNVDGSGTAQEFYINSSNDYDIHIMRIIITIADTAVVHNSFGNIAALGTGWDLKAVEEGASTFFIEKAKTGGQVIEQSGASEPISGGTVADTFELANWTGTEDAQLVTIPISSYIPCGFRIGRGTRDKIISVINDDLTGLTEFYVRCLGYRHYP
jgi:hypothetical protein